MLVIVLPNGHQKHYTKEFLDDCKGIDFVKHMMMPVSKQHHEQAEKVTASHILAEQDAMKQKMLQQLMGMNVQQGFGALLQNQMLMGQQMGMDMGQFMKAMNLGQQPSAPELQQQAMLAQQQQSVDSLAYWKSQYYNQGAPDKLPDMPKALHCYDLGDGMLVPCELANEIVQWINAGKKSPKHWHGFGGFSISKEMIADDLYGTFNGSKKDKPPKGTSLGYSDMEKIYAALYGKNPDDIYPGKVFLVDDVPHVELIESPYLTSKKSWFLDKKTAIPKKPAQITKESLAYFHKLLGGKKDPYIK